MARCWKETWQRKETLLGWEEQFQRGGQQETGIYDQYEAERDREETIFQRPVYISRLYMKAEWIWLFFCHPQNFSDA